MDADIHSRWPPRLVPFAAMLSAFVERRLTGDEFETLFLAARNAALEDVQGDVWNPLDELFYAVDAFCDDPELRDDTDIDEEQLRAAARQAYTGLDAHVRAGRVGLEPGPRRLTRAEHVALAFQHALVGMVPPDLRGVLVECGDDWLRARFLWDAAEVGKGTPAWELTMLVETEVVAALVHLTDSRFVAEPWPAPGPLAPGRDERYVYLRQEPDEEENGP